MIHTAPSRIKKELTALKENPPSNWRARLRESDDKN
jgi:ubiquitin-protein ligase